MMDKKKLITLLLALTMILSLATGASAAETTEARVPVTLTGSTPSRQFRVQFLLRCRFLSLTAMWSAPTMPQSPTPARPAQFV